MRRCRRTTFYKKLYNYKRANQGHLFLLPWIRCYECADVYGVVKDRAITQPYPHKNKSCLHLLARCHGKHNLNLISLCHFCDRFVKKWEFIRHSPVVLCSVRSYYIGRLHEKINLLEIFFGIKMENLILLKVYLLLLLFVWSF